MLGSFRRARARTSSEEKDVSLIPFERIRFPVPAAAEPWEFCKVTLRTNANPNEISATILLRPKLSSKKSWVNFENCPLQYYGISAELHAELTTHSGTGGSNTTSLLNADPASAKIYNSSIAVLVSGNEEGMCKCDPGFPPKHKLDEYPKKFKFELYIPENLQLPPSFSNKNGKVEYFILVCLRTTYNYEVLTKQSVPFPGQFRINRQVAEISKIQKEFSNEEIALTIECPTKFYLLSDNVLVPFTVMARRKDTMDMKPSLSIKIINSISLTDFTEVRVEKEVMDSIPNANCKKTQNTFVFNGILRIQPTERIRKNTAKQVVPTIPSFDVDEIGVKVQYFLECKICYISQGGVTQELVYSEEFMIVTGMGALEILTVPATGSSISTMRPRSMSLRLSSLSLFPPSYSRVGSRRGSLAALDTLPPHYDELMLNHEFEK